ncbi:F0F1 ATP synthase subunit A [Poriferisphaera sp. WC338]|uniref:F0F1 ATP synthase subunit A n=1 Tax=Poriferisphaera sp. WC338 TaxID=3425129 RepID=UPI003D816D17
MKLNMLAVSDPLDAVLPYKYFTVPGTDFAINNQMLLTLLAAVLVLLCFGAASRRIRTRAGQGTSGYVTKGRFAQLLEVFCIFIREEVARPNLGDITDKYIKYIWSVFFFILTINLLGMVPIGVFLALGMELIEKVGIAHFDPHTIHAVEMFKGNANGNINMTAAMALLSFVAIIGIGVKEQGLKYFAHFAPIPFKPIGLLPVALLLVVIEAMGVVIKCMVLAMRLFGTMMAGHLVLGALFGLITTFSAFALPVGITVIVGATAISLLELFFAMLQAFIFTFLTVLFISAGAVHHGDHEHDHEFEAHHDKGMEGIEGVQL